MILSKERPFPYSRSISSQMNFDGIRYVFFEHEAGYLWAQKSCKLVVEKFVEEGGEYHQTSVEPGKIDAKNVGPADAYIFACGPWLGSLFPDVIGDRITSTRQEVFYFEPPSNE